MDYMIWRDKYLEKQNTCYYSGTSYRYGSYRLWKGSRADAVSRGDRCICTEISDIDTSINNVDAESDNAADELLGYLDQLDQDFQDFAALDFPTEFDYLESMADEASEYMTTAVQSYHDAFSNGGYNQLTADYAKENYARAYKRIQIIITFLHGEQPEDVNLTTEEATTEASVAE